ncbi:uncharacterized protein mei-P22 [Eurosta solidaginis]|uniref:uncharacterized protein mei-P22 n=1 Tax=Eurosta solidaginis TaxID=178769 RepID=UPI00353108A9
MRRSQRLTRKPVTYADFNYEGKFLFYDNQNTEVNIEIQKGSADNGSATNVVDLPQISAAAAIHSSKQPTNSILSNNVKNQADEANKDIKVGNNNNNTVKASNSKLKQSVRRGRPPIKRARSKSTSQVKANTQQNKRRRLVTDDKEFEAPILSVDHYLNPLRHPLLQGETKTQIMDNNDFKCYNNMSNMNLKSSIDSLLPQMYPMHFVNQNMANNSFNQTSLAQVFPTATKDINIQQQNSQFPTPELTQSLDFDSSTSTISLTESLREIFGCEDIREVLKMDAIIFRMQIIHLQALAFVLNIQYEYLYALVERIMQLDSGTLQKIVYAFKPVMDTINCQGENKDEYHFNNFQ